MYTIKVLVTLEEDPRKGILLFSLTDIEYFFDAESTYNLFKRLIESIIKGKNKTIKLSKAGVIGSTMECKTSVSDEVLAYSVQMWKGNIPMDNEVYINENHD